MLVSSNSEKTSFPSRSVNRLSHSVLSVNLSGCSVGRSSQSNRSVSLSGHSVGQISESVGSKQSLTGDGSAGSGEGDGSSTTTALRALMGVMASRSRANTCCLPDRFFGSKSEWLTMHQRKSWAALAWNLVWNKSIFETICVHWSLNCGRCSWNSEKWWAMHHSGVYAIFRHNPKKVSNWTQTL